MDPSNPYPDTDAVLFHNPGHHSAEFQGVLGKLRPRGLQSNSHTRLGRGFLVLLLKLDPLMHVPPLQCQVFGLSQDLGYV